MSYVKSGIIVLAAFAVSAPSFVQAQGYTRRGTRNGAIAGALIGGLIGAGNDEALAGAAIGGVVGGITGRVVGSNRDAQRRNDRYQRGGHYQTSRRGYDQYPAQYHGYNQRVQRVQYAPTAPAYRSNYYRGNGGYYGNSCPGRGW